MALDILHVLILLSFMGGIVVLYNGWDSFNIGFVEKKNNDQSPLATDSFISLLNDAEERMDIYDGGNEMPKSIYKNEELVGMVKTKLDTNPNFTIRCIFNSNDSTLFREKFSDHIQVTIRTRKKPRPDLAHYKITDDGKKAYLSWHVYGGENRTVRMYDFSRVKNWPGQKDVKKEYIGECLKDIEDHFAIPHSG